MELQTNIEMEIHAHHVAYGARQALPRGLTLGEITMEVFETSADGHLYVTKTTFSGTSGQVSKIERSKVHTLSI